jgi:Domain of unknown function (DUF4388)
MSYMGDLRQYSLGEILRIVGTGQRRGRLIVERGGSRAEIYCENGHILHVWRSGPAYPLATRWITSNIISQEHIVEIGLRTGTNPSTMNDATFAQTALDLGIITPSQVAEWAMQDAVDLLTILLAWRDGDVRFEEGLTPPPYRLRVPLPFATVVNRAIETMERAPLMPPPNDDINPGDILDFAEVDGTDPHPIRITREQWRILSHMDGASSLYNIATNMTQASGIDPNVDRQRYDLELGRNLQMVLRVASELVATQIVVRCGTSPVSIPN